ncbi:unnamed protein product [Schistosoma curassoni]|uniref:Amino acid transporter transmembrane domain-containing protein n=1 Tax=Schistosoma curassoni TaxID=6186 RepID=A0A183KNL2_9TREM|nr:unnamed protein product [Schistosoma curassoni]
MPCLLVTASHIHSHIWPNIVQMLFSILCYVLVCLTGM